ncbi:MAG: pilus assembly protein [Pirellulales bacterium]|nr:pilus assembly protein [Pirellulales bacterium]
MLVEFALVALVLYLVLAATLELGRLFYSAQVLQAAADVAARELARTPLPPTVSFEEALQWEDPPGSGIRPARRVYDPHYLVLDLDTLGGRSSLMELVADLPVVNQQLFPLMVYSEYQGRRLLRYPGALLLDTDPSDDPPDPPPAGFLVAIPVVASRDGRGVETIRWVDVVEDLQAGDEGAPPGDALDPFNLLSAQRGLVGLRINFPFQAATMSSFDPARDGNPGDPNLSELNVADDTSVTELNSPPGTPVSPEPTAGGMPGTYGGIYGLGGQAALNSPQLAAGFPLRPFRRVLVGQALARREVFAP